MATTMESDIILELSLGELPQLDCNILRPLLFTAYGLGGLTHRISTDPQASVCTHVRTLSTLRARVLSLPMR
jgi:hypothetical protein